MRSRHVYAALCVAGAGIPWTEGAPWLATHVFMRERHMKRADVR